MYTCDSMYKRCVCLCVCVCVRVCVYMCNSIIVCVKGMCV